MIRFTIRNAAGKVEVLEADHAGAVVLPDGRLALVSAGGSHTILTPADIGARYNLQLAIRIGSQG